MEEALLLVDLSCSLGLAAGVALGTPLWLARPRKVRDAALARLVRVYARGGLSPNRISATSLALAALAGGAFALGHFGLGALVVAVAASCAAVVRSTGAETSSRAVLEATIDRYGEFVILLGMAIHVRHDALDLGLVELAMLGSFMVSYASAKGAAFGVDEPRGRRAERSVWLIGGAALVPLTRAVLPVAGENVVKLPLLVALALVGMLAYGSAIRHFAEIGRVAARANTALRAPK